MRDYKVVISTNNGTFTQTATGFGHVGLYISNAMQEPDPGRVVVIIEEVS